MTGWARPSKPLPPSLRPYKALSVGRQAWSLLQCELEWLGTKISMSKILKIFPRNNFSLRFMLPWSLWAENIFSVFKVRNYPSIYDFELEVFPWNAISEARPPLCNTSSEAGALDTGGMHREWIGYRTENLWRQNFSENHFSPWFMLPWSLWAEIIFLNW